MPLVNSFSHFGSIIQTITRKFFQLRNPQRHCELGRLRYMGLFGFRNKIDIFVSDPGRVLSWGALKAGEHAMAKKQAKKKAAKKPEKKVASGTSGTGPRRLTGTGGTGPRAWLTGPKKRTSGTGPRKKKKR